MNEHFPNLFSPVKIGPFIIKNRIAVSPHGPRYNTSDGLMTRHYLDYELEKAKGGAGLIIMSYGTIDPTGQGNSLLFMWRKESVPLFRELTDAVRSYDCRIVFQFGGSFYNSGRGASPSPFSGWGDGYAREMTVADIKEMMGHYRNATETLMEGGFDGVEMHGHGDLFSDFLSPTINRRTDEYGGSLDNRLRYFREALDTIRATTGADKIVGARLSVDDKMPGSVSLQDGVALAKALADTGKLDYLNIDTVIEPQLLSTMIAPLYVEHGHLLYASAAVKQAVTNIPVFTVGRIVDPAMAEKAIADGQADVVTMARALIADPELPNKAREGRVEDIRPCLGDNQECIGRVTAGLPMRCTVNATAGREGEVGIGKIKPAPAARKVLVIGGGPAGMEAARIAAERGHSVRLWEKTDSLGGTVRLARRLPGRADIGRILPWQQRQLERLGVEVRTGVEATVDLVAAEKPDAVVLATGARWLKGGFNALSFQNVKGWEQPNVLSVSDVVSGDAKAGRRVLIFDAKGFVEAPGIAEMLVDQGCQVEIVTPFPALGTDDLNYTLQRDHIMPRVLSKGVVITPHTMLESISGDTATVRDVYIQATRTITVDTVIMISDRASNDQLYPELVARLPAVWRIGDCDSPLNIGKAIMDGHRVGMTV